MNAPRLAIVLIALVLTLAGCLSTTAASLQGSHNASELRVVRTTKGLLWGPCVIAPGSVSSVYFIKLLGEQSTYSPSEFKIYAELPNGDRFLQTVDRGVVEVDRTKHTIRLDLTIGGKPCEVNGQFKFDPKDA